MTGNNIYDDGQIKIWRMNSFEDFASLPFRNKWCLTKEPRFFNVYSEDGYKFYVIETNQNGPQKFIVAGINQNYNEKQFYDANDVPVDEETLSSIISSEAMNVLTGKGVAESRKRTVRLSENELHRVIKEAVKRVLQS